MLANRCRKRRQFSRSRHKWYENGVKKQSHRDATGYIIETQESLVSRFLTYGDTMKSIVTVIATMFAASIAVAQTPAAPAKKEEAKPAAAAPAKKDEKKEVKKEEKKTEAKK